MTGNSAVILQYSMNLPKSPKDPSRSLFAQPNLGQDFEVSALICLHQLIDLHPLLLTHSGLFDLKIFSSNLIEIDPIVCTWNILLQIL